MKIASTQFWDIFIWFIYLGIIHVAGIGRLGVLMRQYSIRIATLRCQPEDHCLVDCVCPAAAINKETQKTLLGFPQPGCKLIQTSTTSRNYTHPPIIGWRTLPCFALAVKHGCEEHRIEQWRCFVMFSHVLSIISTTNHSKVHKETKQKSSTG